MFWIITLIVGVTASWMSVVCQAACNPCPFQWTQHGQHCYRYFPEPLPHDEAEAYCRRYAVKSKAGKLANVSSAEEVQFLMEYVANAVNVTAQTNASSHIRLGNEAYEEHGESWYNKMSFGDSSRILCLRGFSRCQNHPNCGHECTMEVISSHSNQFCEFVTVEDPRRSVCSWCTSVPELGSKPLGPTLQIFLCPRRVL